MGNVNQHTDTCKHAPAYRLERFRWLLFLPLIAVIGSGYTSGGSLCTLYLHACQVRGIVGDSGLCCCVCVRSFEH